MRERILMLLSAVAILMSAVFMAVGFWAYNNRESTMFDDVLLRIQTLSSEFKTLEKLVTSNISTVAQCNEKMGTGLKELAIFRDELEVFREQLEETREKQMRLREVLARKTSKVVMPTGPIPIEVHLPTKQSVGGTSKKELEALKKQIKGLSK